MLQPARSCFPSHGRRAFSLTELFVVMGIMSVLLALSVTVIHVANEFAKNLQHQVDSAKLRVKRSQVRTAATAPVYIGDQYILMLRDDVNPHVEAGRLATVAPFELLEVYHSIYKGLAIRTTAANLAVLLRDSAVRYIEQDQLMSIGAQTVPAGVRRIGADVPAPAPVSQALTPRRPERRTIQIQFSDGTTWWFTLFHPRHRNCQSPVLAAPTPTQGDVDATIAIIDTGVAPHADLNIVFEKGFGALASTSSDRNGHGTHVAGTAAARNNDLGVLGVAPGARIWALKVLDGPENGDASGSGKDVQAALDFVHAHAGQIDVVNMSLGSSASPSLDAAVERCVQAGVTVVVAAGNDRKDASRYSPARAANAITVAALDDTSQPGVADPGDKFASFSNHGAVVDIAAPGVNILSTWLRDEHRNLSGTSMAAPHVAGVAALIKSKYRADSPAMVLGRMQQAVIETIPGPGNRRYPIVNARPFAN